MIKPPQVLLVATASLGCATQEQKSAAVDDWEDCVRSAIERVDDGKTDPMSVADGISAMCAAFYDKVRQSSGTQKGQDANLKEGELRMIVSAILDPSERSAKGQSVDEELDQADQVICKPNSELQVLKSETPARGKSSEGLQQGMVAALHKQI